MQLGVDNTSPPCPFCAWDTNEKAQIKMALVVNTCPCTQRNTVGEAKYLEAVVYHFKEKMEKLLTPKRKPMRCAKPCPPDWVNLEGCVREREHEKETHVLKDGRMWPLDGCNQEYA